MFVVFGSVATPLDPNNRPANISPDHTHQWTVYLRGVDGADVTHWLKKVQFKLHETYSHSLRTIEAPGPFEVTETGWGEFEVALKLFFVAESNEKPASVYHQLKLHPYGPDAERQKENKEPVNSRNYEEIVFNEPVEAFYDILTTGGPYSGRGKGAGKGSKQAMVKKGSERSAEIPYQETESNPFSVKAEGKELDRLKDAFKQVEQLVTEERQKLKDREKVLEELKATEGTVAKPK
jgi:YEATS domain-containing protein 4